MQPRENRPISGVATNRLDSRAALLSLLLLAVGGIGAFYLINGDEPGLVRPPHPHSRALPTDSPSGGGSPVPPSPTPTASQPDRSSPPAATLTYLRGTRLVKRTTGSAVERELLDLHTADVAAAPSSAWLAYVLSRGTSTEDGDFTQVPDLHLLDPRQSEDADLGPGFAPLWSSSGSQLAYLMPTQPRRCDGESCAGAVRVMTVTPGGSPRAISPSGHWHLLAWLGDRVLVANEQEFGRTLSLSGSRNSIPINAPPNEIWDGSPDGRLLVTVTPGKINFTHVVGGNPTDEVRSFHSSATLGDGSWNPASRLIAGVLRTGTGSTRMTLLSEHAGLLPIERSRGAMGSVIWDSAGDRFVYVSVAAENRNRLQANLCNLRPAQKVTCRPWFTWSQGVSLLQLSAP
jgi:hypothetical protein